jgi:hypothetical protein
MYLISSSGQTYLLILYLILVNQKVEKQSEIPYEQWMCQLKSLIANEMEGALALLGPLLQN